MMALPKYPSLVASCLALTTAVLSAQESRPTRPSEPGETAEPNASEAAATEGNELDELLAAIRKAHRQAEAPAVVERFDGKLEITDTANPDQRVSLMLDIRFQDQPLRMRYKVDEGGRRVERGRDRSGGWVRPVADEAPVSVGRAEYEGDKIELRKHLGVAKQLIDFLDPAAVAEAFEKDAVIATEDFRLTKRKSVACRTLTGRMTKFPLYTKGGERLPAEVVLWIDAETHRLRAVEAHAIGADGEPEATGELLLIPEHARRNGLLLPAGIRLDEMLATGARRSLAIIRVLNLDLAPGPGEAQYDRNTRW